jgi:Fe-Mn family superoxide dismutase
MAELSRRQLLQSASAGAAVLALSPLARLAAAEGDAGFTLPKLPYAFDALEPIIDAKTMEIHHDRHHKAYVDNLNSALKGQANLQKKKVGELLRGIDSVPEKIRQAVINNGGGHANHSMFWKIMASPKKGGGGEPKGALAKAIDAAFESLAKFQAKVSTAGMTRFGSGWTWLVSNKGKLEVYSTANQDSPLLKGHVPLLGIDVWEHAYYLKYQNKRADYLNAWWKVVNWEDVAERYNRAVKG